MEITVNGKKQQRTTSVTLAALLAELDLPSDYRGVAVAVNDTVIPQTQWAGSSLNEGDVVEIIRAVQGG